MDSRWAAEGEGGEYAPGNPRNQKLLSAAVDWANQTYGGGRQCVFAACLDLDEKQSSLVDLFMLPLAESRSGPTKTKRMMGAPNPALKRLGRVARGDYAASFAAAQDSWAAYASRVLGADFKRGEPKAKDGEGGWIIACDDRPLVLRLVRAAYGI